MVDPEPFIHLIAERGFRFWSGVPCSFIASLLTCLEQQEAIHYIGASSEGEAVGIAAGAHLAGKRSVVICQNSGLGNMVNPLTSLTYTFRIPMLLLITHRGAPEIRDEPQHTLMGQITEPLLEVLGIPWAVMPETLPEIEQTLEVAMAYMQAESLPYALIIKKGCFAPHPKHSLVRPLPAGRQQVEGMFTLPLHERALRFDALRTLQSLLQGTELLLSTTGNTSRELFELGHHPNQLYVVGSMGCTAGIGLGIALNDGRRKVIVLDGDGAALMKLGTLSTIGRYHPRDFIHVIFDNESYESTGEHASSAASVDFATVALACHYAAAFRCDSLDSFAAGVQAALEQAGPVLIHLKVAAGTIPSLGRPTLTPVQVKDQFMQFLRS